jgi:hypothetical protein
MLVFLRVKSDRVLQYESENTKVTSNISKRAISHLTDFIMIQLVTTVYRARAAAISGRGRG